MSAACHRGRRRARGPGWARYRRCGRGSSTRPRRRVEGSHRRRHRHRCGWRCRRAGLGAGTGGRGRDPQSGRAVAALAGGAMVWITVFATSQPRRLRRRLLRRNWAGFALAQRACHLTADFRLFTWRRATLVCRPKDQPPLLFAQWPLGSHRQLAFLRSAGRILWILMASGSIGPSGLTLELQPSAIEAVVDALGSTGSGAVRCTRGLASARVLEYGTRWCSPAVMRMEPAGLSRSSLSAANSASISSKRGPTVRRRSRSIQLTKPAGG